MGFQSGEEMVGKKVDVVFIGSCTNSRITDLRDAASIIKGKQIPSHVRTMIVPGSFEVKYKAEEEGLDQIFKDAGSRMA